VTAEPQQRNFIDPLHRGLPCGRDTPAFPGAGLRRVRPGRNTPTLQRAP